jgi:hypothetical protein
MTNDTTLWTTLHNHLPRRTWIPLADIYVIVQQRLHLDSEDMECINSRSMMPRWQSNVRRVLYAKKRDGTLSARDRL